MSDQAAGLREWASRMTPLPDPEPVAVTRPLLVVGLPGHSRQQLDRVREMLIHWAGEGWRWVGDPSAWKLVPVAATSAHLGLLAREQSRWALWVDRDREAFRRAYRALKCLESGGLRRLLLIHPPELGRRGLLDNLQQVAASDFGIDLLVLAR